MRSMKAEERSPSDGDNNSDAAPATSMSTNSSAPLSSGGIRHITLRPNRPNAVNPWPENVILRLAHPLSLRAEDERMDFWLSRQHMSHGGESSFRP